VLLACVPAACTKAGTQSAGDAGTLRIAIPIDPLQLNPILPENSMENFVEGLIFDNLVTQDDHHRQIPDLAAVVPTVANGGISKDGLTITYRLRRGVKWHDGAPFTSKDVAFTYRAIMNPANNVLTRHGYDLIASLDTPDDYTVVMHMKKVFAPAIDTIFGESDTIYRILPEHLLAKYPNINQIPFNGAPVGTGPFRFVRWQRGDHIELAANPGYFRGAPKLSRLDIKIITDDNTTQSQVRSREVDLALEITAPAYRDLGGVPGVTRQLVDAPIYSALLFNTQRGALTDVRVRHALVLGLNRPAIFRDDTYGTARYAVADLSPYYWAYDPSLKPVPYDPAQAKALLDAAGWHVSPGGIRVRNGQRLSLQLAYGRGSSISQTVVAQAGQDYEALGVEVTGKSYDLATLYASAGAGGVFNGGKFDIALYPWVSGADPDNSSQWMCDQIPPNGNNITRYCSTEMDAQQQLALSTFDRSARKNAYAKIESLLLQDAPGAFLYYYYGRYAKIDGLQNFRPNGTSEGWNAATWERSP
jgi:peptide/nickel transport system substrate-binding protein